MRLGGGDVLRAARLLSLLLSEDEEDKREGAGSLSFYLFSEILQLGKLHNIRCTGKVQYGIYIPISIFFCCILLVAEWPWWSTTVVTHS